LLSFLPGCLRRQWRFAAIRTGFREWLENPPALEDVQRPVMDCRSSKMRVVEVASEIGVEHDRLDPGCLLFRPAQSPGRGQPSIGCSPQPRLGELPGVEQQARVHFAENLARDGSQQLHCLLEMGLLVLATCGAAVRTVPKILKNP